MVGTETTPTVEHLFEVSISLQFIDENTKQYVHNMTANFIFLSKRARPDIFKAVEFLTTWVKLSYIYGYKKLGRIINYLRWYLETTLTIEADNSHIMKFWVDE